jgi:hypothetical protein
MNGLIKTKLSLLVLDYTVYPRHKISEYNVNTLLQALESGATLPPIMWDKNTGIVIDGFHRITAYRRKYGPDYIIEGEAIDCKDKKEIIIKGAEINNRHGMRLSAWDQSRCLAIAAANGIVEEIMQKALSIPKERVELLKKRIVEVRDARGKFMGNTQLKRGQESIAKKQDGIYVTLEEQKQIEGGTTGLNANIRIRTLIKDIDLNNLEVTSKNIKSIKELHELLGEIIAGYENE